MAGVKNWLYDLINPDPQKMAETRALIDRSTESRARALDSQVESVLGSYEPSQPREPAPEFRIGPESTPQQPIPYPNSNRSPMYEAPVVGSGVRAPRPANPVMDELDSSPAYQQFKRQQAAAPVGPAAPVAPAVMEDPAPIAPAAEVRAPIRMFTTAPRDGAGPGIPTYSNVGTRGDVVDLSAQQNVGGPEDNGIDSEAYRRYRRNLLGDSEYAAELAGVAESGARAARGRALTADPFAPEAMAQQQQFDLLAARAKYGEQQDVAKMRNQAGMRREQLGQLSALKNARVVEHQKVDSLSAQHGLTPQQIQAAHDAVDQVFDNEELGLDLPSDVRKVAAQ